MLLLKNALLYPVTRTPFRGDLLTDNGKIISLGEGLSAPGAEEIDLAGRSVFPGFIDAHCHVGMWEDGMGTEGADGNESSNPITPQMRAIDGLNPFDPCFMEGCRAGVTTLVTGPGSANVIGGQFAALKTAGASLDEKLILAPVAMKAAVGENPKVVYGGNKVTPLTRMAIASLFRKTLTDAQEYAAAKERGKTDPDKSPAKDMAMEALLPVLSRELPMKIHAHRADDILTALRLAREFHIRITIEHCTEGHLITDVLKPQLDELGARIIVGPLLSERSKIELRNLSYDAPRILWQAGIPFAMMTDHPVIPIQYLPVCAGLAVRSGLPEDVALASITIEPARTVGLDARIGSLDPGKDADLAVYDGHPFDTRARCVLTLVNGARVYDAREA